MITLCQITPRASVTLLATPFGLAWAKVNGASIADWTLTGIITVYFLPSLYSKLVITIKFETLITAMQT
jgi:chromate transport protein ChrA